MVLWTEILNAIADVMNMDATSAGIIFSCICIIATFGIIAYFTKGHQGATFLSGDFALILFVVLGWLPYWTLLFALLLVVGAFADQVRSWLGGSK